MPNIKLKDGSGIEQTYTNIQSITVPLADGTGNMTYGVSSKMLPQVYDNRFWAKWNLSQLEDYGAIGSISSIPIRNMSIMFSNTTVDLGDYNLTTDVNSTYGLALERTFENSKIKSFPTLSPYYLYGNGSNYAFNYCDFSELVGLPTQIFDSMIGISGGYYTTDGRSSSSGSASFYINMFDYSNVEELNFSKFSDLPLNPSYLWYFTQEWFLKKVTLPVPNYEFTSNKFSNRPSYNLMLGSILFDTNNGTPYSARWKSQSIDFSGNSSYMIGSITSNWVFNGTELGWTNIYASTKESTVANYNAIKNTNNRWAYKATGTDWTTSYTAPSGNTYNCLGSRLFSHFNHDSAVAFINSLPDTSAYLATASGSNTIMFHPASGGLTDEGEVGLLTAEEIAVATAKGWTVTFSAYTN